MASFDAGFNGSIFRKSFPMIIAQNRQLASIEPVRLAYDAGGYLAGTVLARNSVSGQYAKYNDGASSGLDTAKGVLFEDHPVEHFSAQVASGSTMARCIFGGEVYKDLLVGFDAAADADLKGRTIVDATSVNVYKF